MLSSPLVPIAILSLVAAFVSWRLASRRGRNAFRWALATLLLGGLPLIWLVIDAWFGLPTPKETVRPACCDRQTWTPVADLGHAGGVDLDLGRCGSCGASLMSVFYGVSGSHVVISPEEAERFLRLQGTPELKKALKDWLG